MYQLYIKWGDADAYYHTAFIHGVLLASFINFLIALLLLITRNPIFKFSLYPIGLILAVIIGLVVFYFHRRRTHFIHLDKNPKILKNTQMDNWIVAIVVSIMLLTWILTPILYKFATD